MPVIIRQVSLVLFFNKLFLDLIKQVIFTGRVDADFVSFDLRNHGTVIDPRYDPVHVDLVPNCAVMLEKEEAIIKYGLVLTGL